MMRTDALLRIARETIAKVPACMAITVDRNGDASARVVNPKPLTNEWTVRFPTDRRSRKSAEIKRSGRLTLAYQYDAGKAYVSMVGSAAICDDVAVKISGWGAGSDKWFPGGPTDANVVYVDFVAERIELWSSSEGIVPDPAQGLWATALVREGSGWVQATTFPGSPVTQIMRRGCQGAMFAQSGGIAAAMRLLSDIFKRNWSAFQEWRKREVLRVNLSDLTDRELMDIGITRGEIDYVASDRAVDPRSGAGIAPATTVSELDRPDLAPDVRATRAFARQ